MFTGVKIGWNFSSQFRVTESRKISGQQETGNNGCLVRKKWQSAQLSSDQVNFSIGRHGNLSENLLSERHFTDVILDVSEQIS